MIPPKEWVWKDAMWSRYCLSGIETDPSVVDVVMQHVIDELAYSLNDLKEQAIEMAIYQYTEVTAKQPFKVKITRPWWMPLRLHRWLFKQVVLFESKEAKITTEEKVWFDAAVDDE